MMDLHDNNDENGTIDQNTGIPLDGEDPNGAEQLNHQEEQEEQSSIFDVGLRRRHQARFANGSNVNRESTNTNNEDGPPRGWEIDRDDNANDDLFGNAAATAAVNTTTTLPTQRPFDFPAARQNPTSNNDDIDNFRSLWEEQDQQPPQPQPPQNRRQQQQGPSGGGGGDFLSFHTSRSYFFTTLLLVVLSIVIVSPPPNIYQLLSVSYDPLFVEYYAAHQRQRQRRHQQKQHQQQYGPFQYKDFLRYKENKYGNHDHDGSIKYHSQQSKKNPVSTTPSSGSGMFSFFGFSIGKGWYSNDDTADDNKNVIDDYNKQFSSDGDWGILSSIYDTLSGKTQRMILLLPFTNYKKQQTDDSARKRRSSQRIFFQDDNSSFGTKKDEKITSTTMTDPSSTTYRTYYAMEWFNNNIMEPLYHTYYGTIQNSNTGVGSSSLSYRRRSEPTTNDKSKKGRTVAAQHHQSKYSTGKSFFSMTGTADGTGEDDDDDDANNNIPPPTGISRFFMQSVTFQRLYFIAEQFIDPALLHPTSDTPTDLIDKVLTSNPRIAAVANFMLAITYLLHSLVAVWFLGPPPSTSRQRQQPQQQQQQEEEEEENEFRPPAFFFRDNDNDDDDDEDVHVFADWSTSPHGGPTGGAARERMGGFLVFKLLLVCAVVSPDTFDLLILMTWYTTMSCLKSLDHLAHGTTKHLLALGQPPRKGVVQLLFWILISDIIATICCVALFHSAGWSMVLLLISDCIVLAFDVLQHILKHFAAVLEHHHSEAIQQIEARQLELHNNGRDTNQAQHAGGVNDRNSFEESGNDWEILHGENIERNAVNDHENRSASEHGVSQGATLAPDEAQRESNQLDRQMELMELSHARKIAILDNAMFAFDLMKEFFQIFHFCHIWSLHGIQCTLIDGVLALHLQSSISSVLRKIAQRRNINALNNDLQRFPDADEDDLRKAAAAGDVCSICLGTMTAGGHVKKLKCGHLFHTHCLREIIERTQSIHAAKCPLCRSSLVDGTRSDRNEANNNDDDDVPDEFIDPAAVDRDTNSTNNVARDDRALFRFSTENLLPTWLPLPAFSFEVVRRPPGSRRVPAVGGMQPPPRDQADDPPPPDQPAAPPVEGGAVPQDDIPATAGNNEPSFLRRFLVMAGAIPMTPEEEARAIDQLVDMFPQYDRRDLLRELRQRRSAEAVAESVLLGVFTGVPRGN